MNYDERWDEFEADSVARMDEFFAGRNRATAARLAAQSKAELDRIENITFHSFEALVTGYDVEYRMHALGIRL